MESISATIVRWTSTTRKRCREYSSVWLEFWWTWGTSAGTSRWRTINISASWWVLSILNILSISIRSTRLWMQLLGKSAKKPNDWYQFIILIILLLTHISMFKLGMFWGSDSAAIENIMGGIEACSSPWLPLMFPCPSLSLELCWRLSTL